MPNRLLKIILAIVFIFLCLILFFFQIIKGSYFERLSKRNCIRIIPLDAMRGQIFDRNGMAIAENKSSYDLTVFLQETQKDKALSQIAKILNENKKNLENNFKKNYIAPFIPTIVKENIPKSEIIKIEENKLDLPGIAVERNYTRFYPYASLACHVLGYLSKIDKSRLQLLKPYGYKPTDLVGFSGVEEKYDSFLRETKGGMQVEVDHRGRLVRILGLRKPKDGQDIYLTIDLRIQRIIENALLGRRGAIVIIDSNTGEILALASYPNFDPELFVLSSDKSKAWLRALLRSQDSPFLNRAISGSFAPGSIFKPVVAIAGLETKKITPNTTFNCQGTFKIGNRGFNCWSTHGIQDLTNAIGHSCNIFFYHAGLILGPNIIVEYAQKFCFGQETLIDLPNEAKGALPNPFWRRIKRLQRWFDGDTANFAIGQGELLVTPLQVTRMMNVFATGGLLVRPYVVKQAGNKKMMPSIEKLTFRKDNIDIVRKGLLDVVKDETGTAHNLYMDNLSIAGKTGTAQVHNNKPHGWFVGYFPENNPKMTMCVFLENAGSGTASSFLAKKIIEELLKENLIW